MSEESIFAPLSRTFRGYCPHCGIGRLFDKLKPNRECFHCHLPFKTSFAPKALVSTVVSILIWLVGQGIIPEDIPGEIFGYIFLGLFLIIYRELLRIDLGYRYFTGDLKPPSPVEDEPTDDGRWRWEISDE